MEENNEGVKAIFAIYYIRNIVPRGKISGGYHLAQK